MNLKLAGTICEPPGIVVRNAALPKPGFKPLVEPRSRVERRDRLVHVSVLEAGRSQCKKHSGVIRHYTCDESVVINRSAEVPELLTCVSPDPMGVSLTVRLALNPLRGDLGGSGRVPGAQGSSGIWERWLGADTPRRRSQGKERNRPEKVQRSEAHYSSSKPRSGDAKAAIAGLFARLPGSAKCIAETTLH